MEYPDSTEVHLLGREEAEYIIKYLRKSIKK